MPEFWVSKMLLESHVDETDPDATGLSEAFDDIAASTKAAMHWSQFNRLKVVGGTGALAATQGICGRLCRALPLQLVERDGRGVVRPLAHGDDMRWSNECAACYTRSCRVTRYTSNK